jgi:hypothetical protein
MLRRWTFLVTFETGRDGLQNVCQDQPDGIGQTRTRKGARPLGYRQAQELIVDSL